MNILEFASHAVPHHSPSHSSGFHPVYVSHHSTGAGSGISNIEACVIVLAVIGLAAFVFFCLWWFDPKPKPNQFKCSKCGKIEDKSTPEEVRAEAIKNLGAMPESYDLVCDKCYADYLKKYPTAGNQ